MAKRVSIFLIICISLLFTGPAWGILYYYTGTMDSTFEITHTYTTVVPDGLSSLTFTVPLPEDYSLPNISQNITELNYTYTGTPSIEDYTDKYESHFRKFVWTNPVKGNIVVTLNYTVSASSDWDVLIPNDPFPFDSSSLPESVAEFLEPTDYVQSDDPVLINLVNDLTYGLHTQREALTALNGWIMENISYGSNPWYDALSTFALKYGNCTNYAHLAVALVRAAGIPARFTIGYSLSKTYTLPTGNSTIDASWGQGSHAWIEVYYPSLGWVPYDPQRDLHHVDTHRVLWGRGIDTEDVVGFTSWTFESAPLGYPMQYQNLKVNWIDDSIDLSYIKSTSEIDSFSLSSAVDFIQDHTITSSTGSGGRILPDGKIDIVDGASQYFTITPNSGYKVEDVLVDGVSQGAVRSYSFSNITADHTIAVEFSPSATGGGGGGGCFLNTIGFR